MTIHKLSKHQGNIPYTMISREVSQQITNPDSLAIWTYLQSLPEDWNISGNYLRQHFCIGKTRYMAAMRVLRDLGLYEVIAIKNDKNQFIGNYYHVYAHPKVLDPPKVQKPILPETGLPENSTDITEKISLHRTIKDTEKDILSGKPDFSYQRNQIITYLNMKTGAKFQSNSKNAKKHINARIKDGKSPEDFMRVIDSKQREWSGTRFAYCLRPETLFAGKFETYLAQAHLDTPQDYHGIDICIQNLRDHYEQTGSGNIGKQNNHQLGGKLGQASISQAGSHASEIAPVGKNSDSFTYL